MIPEFNNDGNLPPGVYATTWEAFVDRFGKTKHRQKRLNGLAAALEILQTVGCCRVYIDGSFVSKKRIPNDYDVAWDPVGVDLSRLKSLAPVFFNFANRRAAQKAVFLGEFFPSNALGDRAGNTILEFFQTDKQTCNRKGIIALNL